MGKKPQKHSWPEAKKLCRLNQDDIAMAKRLGFGPDSLIRNRPDPRQRWKLPVKDWIRELHLERFGYIPGEKPIVPVVSQSPEYDEEAVRLFGEQLYWDDYWDRNQDDGKDDGKRKHTPGKPKQAPKISTPTNTGPPVISDDDVPF